MHNLSADNNGYNALMMDVYSLLSSPLLFSNKRELAVLRVERYFNGES